jgi:hypothetical protein
MSIGSDAMSNAATDALSRCNIDPEKQKKIMKKIYEIKDPNEMKLYVLKHQDFVNTVPTKFLNNWNDIKDYKFVRRNGYVSF